MKRLNPENDVKRLDALAKKFFGQMENQEFIGRFRAYAEAVLAARTDASKVEQFARKGMFLKMFVEEARLIGTLHGDLSRHILQFGIEGKSAHRESKSKALLAAIYQLSMVEILGPEGAQGYASKIHSVATGEFAAWDIIEKLKIPSLREQTKVCLAQQQTSVIAQGMEAIRELAAKTMELASLKAFQTTITLYRRIKQHEQEVQGRLVALVQLSSQLQRLIESLPALGKIYHQSALGEEPALATRVLRREDTRWHAFHQLFVNTLQRPAMEDEAKLLISPFAGTCVVAESEMNITKAVLDAIKTRK